jgi:hypothetical protein
MNKAKTAWQIPLLFLVTSCGNGAADLTCEYLADPANCWASAAAEAKACLPATAETGVLAADRSSCSFTNGARVLFDDPLPDYTEDLERFAFTIEKDDSSCARFVDTFQNRLELEAGGISATGQLHAGSRFVLSCGDGKSYEADFGLLFECAAGTQPTDGFSVAPDLVTFMIIAVTTPGELFRCAP